MLNINTQKKQTILIGHEHTLRLMQFNDESIRVEVCRGDISIVSNWLIFNIKAGESRPILEDVVLHYVGTRKDSIHFAILGFEAPRDIKIIGEWKTGNTDPGPVSRDKLGKMCDASLLYYATMNATTALEHELMSRFKKHIR